ncbi:MAG TPA: hypothetical protein VNK96_09040 [Fimbriimonadales bacterium]|nr:hypothetical protein [Fimbriimonadales bacterium]
MEWIRELPDKVEEACRSLFEALPLDKAMAALVPKESHDKEILELAERVVRSDAFAELLEAQAGIWLYVDELERSHKISQNLTTREGMTWHGIMHRREGDFGNSKYWFRQAGFHQALKAIPEYEPFHFIDECARRYLENPHELVEMQRREWVAMFVWCAKHGH